MKFCPRWKNKAKPGVRKTTDLEMRKDHEVISIHFSPESISISYRNTFLEERLSEILIRPDVSKCFKTNKAFIHVLGIIRKIHVIIALSLCLTYVIFALKVMLLTHYYSRMRQSLAEISWR